VRTIKGDRVSSYFYYAADLVLRSSVKFNKWFLWWPEKCVVEHWRTSIHYNWCETSCMLL